MDIKRDIPSPVAQISSSGGGGRNRKTQHGSRRSPKASPAVFQLLPVRHTSTLLETNICGWEDGSVGKVLLATQI